MAIVSVQEIHDGRAGEGTTGKPGKRAVKRYTRRWRVVTNSVYDGPYEVLSAAGIPRQGDVYPSDPDARAEQGRAEQYDKSKFVWYVSVNYSDEREYHSCPYDVPAEIEWDTDTVMEPFYFDNEGNAILNSAGEFFETPIKDEVSYWTITITKNVPYVPTWISTYRNAVNSSAFYIDNVLITAGQAKIKKIKIGRSQKQNGYTYRELQLVLKIQDDWMKYILDQGLHQIRDNKLTFCTDSNGVRATKPMLLNGSGVQITVPVTNPSDAVFLEVDIRNEKDFSVLPLT